MNHDAAPAPEATRSLVTPYIALWAVLALVAAGYIGWLATGGSTLAGGSPSQGESNEGQRAMAAALDEVQSLKESVSSVKREVSEIKAEMAAAGERSQQLAGRLSALEDKPSSGKIVTAPAAPAPEPKAAAPAPTAKAPDAKDTKSASAKTASALPKVLNSPPKALETGSVANGAVAAATDAAPVVFGPAIVKPASQQMAVQVATGPSLDSLRLSWSLLSDRHGDTLKNLEARYVTETGADGPSYDLVAGPIKSAAEARKVCAALEAKSVPCRVGDFRGDAL